jgi:hypothetical protein
MTSVTPVKSKGHKEGSASKGERRRAQSSKQGYSAHKLFRQTGLNYGQEAAVVTTIYLN